MATGGNDDSDEMSKRTSPADDDDDDQPDDSKRWREDPGDSSSISPNTSPEKRDPYEMRVWVKLEPSGELFDFRAHQLAHTSTVIHAQMEGWANMPGQSNGTKESPIVFNEEDIDREAMKVLYTYINDGYLRLTEDNLLWVFLAAQFFLMDNLEDKCCQFLEKRTILTSRNYLLHYLSAKNSMAKRLVSFIESSFIVPLRKQRDRLGFGNCNLAVEVAKGVIVPVHRALLAEVSRVIKRLLEKVKPGERLEDGLDVISLTARFPNPSNGCVLGLTFLIDYSYTQEVIDLDPARVSDVLAVAKKLKANALVDNVLDHFLPKSIGQWRIWHKTALRQPAESDRGRRMRELCMLSFGRYFDVFKRFLIKLEFGELMTYLESDFWSASEAEIVTVLDEMLETRKFTKMQVLRVLRCVRYQHLDIEQLPARMRLRWSNHLELMANQRDKCNFSLRARYWPQQIVAVETPNPRVALEHGKDREISPPDWVSCMGMHRYNLSCGEWGKPFRLGFSRPYAAAFRNDLSTLVIVDATHNRKNLNYNFLDLNTPHEALTFSSRSASVVRGTPTTHLSVASRESNDPSQHSLIFCSLNQIRNDGTECYGSNMTAQPPRDFLNSKPISKEKQDEMLYLTGDVELQEDEEEEQKEEERPREQPTGQPSNQYEARVLVDKKTDTLYIISPSCRTSTWDPIKVYVLSDGCKNFKPELLKLPSPGELPFEASYAIMGNQLVMVGGWRFADSGTQRHPKSLASGHVFDLTGEITYARPLPDLNVARDCCGLVATDDGRKLYAISGLSRTGLATEEQQRKLGNYYVKGKKCHSAEIVPSVEVYDVSENKWTMLEANPPRFKSGSVQAFLADMGEKEVLEMKEEFDWHRRLNEKVSTVGR